MQVCARAEEVRCDIFREVRQTKMGMADIGGPQLAGESNFLCRGSPRGRSSYPVSCTSLPTCVCCDIFREVGPTKMGMADIGGLMPPGKKKRCASDLLGGAVLILSDCTSLPTYVCSDIFRILMVWCSGCRDDYGRGKVCVNPT